MLRFGLEDGHIRTMEETGSALGISRQRGKQIEVVAIRKPVGMQTVGTLSPGLTRHA